MPQGTRISNRLPFVGRPQRGGAEQNECREDFRYTAAGRVPAIWLSRGTGHRGAYRFNEPCTP